MEVCSFFLKNTKHRAMKEALFQSKITGADAFVTTGTWHTGIMLNAFRVVAVTWVNSIVTQLLRSCEMHVAQNRL